MSERENLDAGIYMALTAFVILICLLGALLLPPSVFNYGRVLGIVVLFLFLVGTPVLLRIAHRSRIQDAVQKLGGTVLRIKRLPFWDQPHIRYSFFLGTRYRVEYSDLMGVTHRAVCNSGFFQGVEWLEDVLVDVR